MDEINSVSKQGEDPVTEAAVAAALAATDIELTEPSLLHKIMLSTGVFFFVLSVASNIVTAINSVQNYQQNKTIKKDQQCLSDLAKAQENDTQARIKISSDDREAVDNLIQSVFNAKTKKEGQAAFTSYNKRRAENEREREQLSEVKISCSLNISKNAAQNNSSISTVIFTQNGFPMKLELD